MAIRIGPGPVFVYESLIFCRRWQVYAGRALFVLAILIGLWAAWWSNLNGPAYGQPFGTRPGNLQALARAGESFFWALAGIQLMMVLLVAPAATAGAICHDRARGILAQMAITDLSAAEIVLGKLFSRLAPILALLAYTLPVTAMAALLGGVDIQALFSLFVVSAAVAVLGCTLAMAVSVEVVKTHEAIMAVLALWTLWLMSLPIWSGMSRFNGVPPPPDWYQKANPFLLVYAPYSWPGYVDAVDVALFAVGALAISAVLAASTVARLRRAVLPVEVVRPARKWRALSSRFPDPRRWLAWLPGPSLDGNPVLWREWHRSRPSRMTRVLWGAYWFGSIAAVGFGVANAIAYGMDTPSGGFVLIMSMLMLSFLGMLLLSGQAPTSLGEERVRGSLDVLMATPISTRAIVWGKWLGTYRIVLWLTMIPALAAAIMICVAPMEPTRFRAASVATSGPTILDIIHRLPTLALVVAELLSYGAAITSLGLLLATWFSRPGRAIGISVAVFVLIAVGWPYAFDMVIWRPLLAWLMTSWNLQVVDVNWLARGVTVISPLLGPAITLDALISNWAGSVWKFNLVAMACCLLACASAVAMFWMALRSFDRCLGRMRETSQGDGADVPARLVPVGAGCQNEDG
jgi:ABC-type transport system involved in multi-copper enzyme maturation permease subunit